jgi:xanthine dehydrogenase molybdopterin-binding subunit B
VKFDNLTQTARTFTSEITILPPLANSERIPENFSHTYTLEGLEDGDYFFSVSVNEDKHIIRTKFTVTGKTYFVDISKEELVKVKIQDMIILQRTITNPQDADQNFIHVLQVKDERGLTVSLKWISGELSAKESRHISQTWMPEAVKTYSLQFFVWESMESPRILDEMYQITVEVS